MSHGNQISSEIPVTIRRHPRARQLRLTVKHNGQVLMTVPRRVSMATAKLFIKKHLSWVQQKIEANQVHQSLLPRTQGVVTIHRYRARARALITKKVRELNQHYQFHVGKISVRNQQSRWGSCSRQGNLNFNFRLLFLEEALLNYVVVHELCHLQEMNHSKKFWQLVETTIPNFKERRQALRKIHV